MGLNWTYHTHQFILSFLIFIFCSFRVVDKAGYPSAFYCSLNTHYRIVSYRCSDHWQILSPDKTEWRFISTTLCGWRHCFVADQSWFTTRIREEEVTSDYQGTSMTQHCDTGVTFSSTTHPPCYIIQTMALKYPLRFDKPGQTHTCWILESDASSSTPCDIVNALDVSATWSFRVLKQHHQCVLSNTARNTADFNSCTGTVMHHCTFERHRLSHDQSISNCNIISWSSC